jgi:hypothetical protein
VRAAQFSHAILTTRRIDAGRPSLFSARWRSFLVDSKLGEFDLQL